MIGVDEKRSNLRTRTYKGYTPEEVLALLRVERFSGNMSVNFAQGGIASVVAEDRQGGHHLTENKTNA